MMTHSHATLRKLAFAAILLAVPVGDALAQDITAVSGRLLELAAHQGLDLAWSNATGDASQIVLEGVILKPAGEADGMPIGNVTLSGVTEKDGGFLVDVASTAPFALSEQGVSITASPIVLKGLSLPAENDADPMASFMMYRNASMDSLSVEMSGKTAFALQNMTASMAPAEGGRPMAFSGGVARFTTDLSLIEDPKVKGYIDALGYGRLEGDIKVDGSWQPSDGRWQMSRYDIAIDDVGTLGMTVDLGGLTPEFLKAANETSATMAAAPEGTDKSAQEARLMGMLKDATFHGASLRFKDDSLTGRAINLVAMLQGARPEDVVNMAKAALPFAMMQVQMVELASAITPAVNAFLDKPGSIEIVAKPDRPVTFEQIGAVSVATPNDSAATANALWSLLGVKVVANQ